MLGIEALGLKSLTQWTLRIDKSSVSSDIERIFTIEDNGANEYDMDHSTLVRDSGRVNSQVRANLAGRVVLKEDISHSASSAHSAAQLKLVILRP